jgi:hypothetical protein
MKKTLYLVCLSLTVIIILGVAVYAASFSGSIWTNTPNWLGFGYYCTAAKNTSTGGDINHSYAKCYDSSLNITSSALTTGSVTAIANNAKTKPYRGYGKYWQDGTTNLSYAWFYEGSWD